MLEPLIYRDAFHREATALTAAAQKGLTAPVPSCPGWSVATLVTHLTGIYAHRIKLITLRATEDTVQRYEDLDLPPAYKEWFEANLEDRDLGPAAMPPDLLDLFARTAAALETVLWSVEPGLPIYTWWQADQTAGFWQRRMAQETAIHRWDTQLAHGEPASIEPELASDGIDESLDVMLPMRPVWSKASRQGSGETYHFHRTDGTGEWLVWFGSGGPVVTREHTKADVALRGSASDLLLWLWGRIPASRLEVFGDAALLDRYVELVPPD